VLAPGRHPPLEQIRPHGRQRAKSRAELNVGRWRSGALLRGLGRFSCRSMPRARTGVGVCPGGDTPPGVLRLGIHCSHEDSAQRADRAGAGCRGCSVRGGHVLGPPPTLERAAGQVRVRLVLSGGPNTRRRVPAAGQARQSSQPTPPSGGTVRRDQESTAAVAIGRCRLPDKSREPTGESDGLHSSRPGVENRPPLTLACPQERSRWRRALRRARLWLTSAVQCARRHGGEPPPRRTLRRAGAES
jgi:hypothetical protein